MLTFIATIVIANVLIVLFLKGASRGDEQPISNFSHENSEE